MIDVTSPDYSNTPSDRRRPTYPYQPACPVLSPLVSIITPYFNTGEVFRETAMSVLNQSLQNWEWLIIDDGSTEPSAISTLEEVVEMDDRIKVIRQENKGPSAARNHGFAVSVGRFVCVLDSDDLLEPTFLEKCILFLEAQQEFGFCNGWTVNFGTKQFLWTLGFETGARHVEANSGPPIAVLRREVYQAAGGFDEGIRHGHEDWDFWLRVAAAGFWGHTLREYLAWYRNRNAGRFVQFMAEPGRHDEFCAALKQRHGDLVHRFPAPKLREVAPYESVRTAFPLENTLTRHDAAGSVLFVVPWMVTGGADRVNIDWINGLLRRGYRVSVVATLSTAHVWQHKFEELTPDVFVLSTFLRLTDYPAFIDYLITSRRIDCVVISGSTIGYNVLPLLRVKHPTVAFVDLCHVEEPHWNSGGHPRHGVGSQDLLDANVVTTRHLKEWMTGIGADSQRIEVCYTGANPQQLETRLERRSAIRAELGIPEGHLLAIFAGRLCAQKRPLLLPQIVKSARQRGSSVRLLIIGGGELHDALVQSVKEQGVEDLVSLLGPVSHDRWLDLVASSDVLMMPSDYEGIAVALFEAMALGVVPLMSDVGGLSEVVTEETGHLVPKGDGEIDAFADFLSKYANKPSLLRERSVASKHRVLTHFHSEHGIDTFVEAIARARHRASSRTAVVLTERTAAEVATLGIEFFRLSNAAHTLWNHWVKTKDQSIPVQREAAPANPDPFSNLGESEREAAIEVINEYRFLLTNPRPRRFVLPLLSVLESVRGAVRRSLGTSR